MKSFRVLVLSLATLSALFPLSGKPKQKTSGQRQFQEKLSKDLQPLHALDRLSYGPRSGEYALVKKMGVKKYWNQQLTPENLRENPDLKARLQYLTTLDMDPLQIWRAYPQTQFIAQYLVGKTLPDDPEFRREVAAQSRLFRLKAEAGPNGAAGDIEPARKLEEFLSPADITRLQKGTRAEKLLILRSVPDADLDAFLLAIPNAQRQQLLAIAPVGTRRKILRWNSAQQLIAYDLLEAKLARAIYGTHQLEEQLLDFWYNHFNVYLDKGNDRYLVPLYEQQAIRPRVLGRFRDLLQATAESPAMLYYLDNFQSVAPPPPDQKGPKKNVRGLNENYARELLELHTLGVEGGYTQKDIVEVARCFTGWTIQEQRKGSTFTFNPKTHDKGEKVVLGEIIPPGGGIEDGYKVLDILSRHPSTARFVSRKLAQRFVSDEPPPSLIEAMAGTFTKTDGDIRMVMRTMLESKEFWSKGAYHAKLKSPFEMIASAARALDADVDYGYGLAQQVAVLGQPLYRKLEPTGYSNTSEEWINSGLLLARLNFGMNLAQNRLTGIQVDARQFGEDADPQRIARLILFADASPQTRQVIESALQKEREKNPKRAPAPGLVAGLVLGSPDFQRR